MAGNPLVQKLSSFVDLTREEQQALDGWCLKPINLFARKTFIHEGERPEHVWITLTGWAHRYIDTSRGRRQIVGFLLPGDLCNAHAFILKSADHSVAAFSDATVASVRRETLLATTRAFPRLEDALRWATLVEEGVTRQWLVNIGQRDAKTRLAHLLCELWTRADAIGLAKDGSLTLPLTQQDLGDALGLTGVHVNRSIRMLREEGCLRYDAKKLTPEDVERLKRIAAFDPTYLQLERRRHMFDE